MTTIKNIWIIFISTTILFSMNHFRCNVIESRDIFNLGVSVSQLAPKAILITGGMGNIGKYVVSDLLHRGFHIASLDVQDLTNQLKDVFETDKAYEFPARRFKFIKGDIRNLTAVRSILAAQDAFRITGVIHLAAVSRVQNCNDNPFDCRDVNVRGTTALLESLNDYTPERPWLVFTSSREVYGSRCTPEQACDETSAIAPINLYGQTKWEGEEAIRMRSPHKLKGYAILRLASVYGGLYDIPQRLIPSIASETLRNGTITLNGGHQFLDFVHIADVVQSISRAVDMLQSEGTSTIGEVLICSGKSTAVTEITKVASELFRTRAAVTVLEADRHYPMNFVCDNRKMLHGLLRRPLMYGNIHRGLEHYVNSIYTKNAHVLKTVISESCNVDRMKEGHPSTWRIAYCQGCNIALQRIESIMGKTASAIELENQGNLIEVKPCDVECRLIGSCVFTGHCRCDFLSKCDDVYVGTPFPFGAYAFTNHTSYCTSGGAPG